MRLQLTCDPGRASKWTSSSLHVGVASFPADWRSQGYVRITVASASVVGALFCDPPRFTTFEPPQAASWAFPYRTAWRMG
jgi:hypothetical protein